MNVRALDVSDLAEGTADSRALLWWGNIAMMVIEGTMFAMLIGSYLYLRMANLDWPPQTVQPPDLTFPTINIIILVLSLIPMIWADLGAKYDQVWRVKIGFAICIAVGIVFLYLRWKEMLIIGFKWSDHAYGSMIWTIIGLHSFHMIACTAEVSLLFLYTLFMPVSKKKLLDIRCTALYWYFVLITWAPFYFIVYIVPHVSRKVRG